jgi:hypothetical protein
MRLDSALLPASKTGSCNPTFTVRAKCVAIASLISSPNTSAHSQKPISSLQFGMNVYPQLQETKRHCSADEVGITCFAYTSNLHRLGSQLHVLHHPYL